MALIYAHRGFSALYPENTMLAFRKAAMAGADGIELDVHLSKDGEVMIIHDEKLGRTCGLDGVVSDYTRTELEKINAGKTKDERFGFKMKDFELIGAYQALIIGKALGEGKVELIKREGLQKRVIDANDALDSVLESSSVPKNNAHTNTRSANAK